MCRPTKRPKSIEAPLDPTALKDFSSIPSFYPGDTFDESLLYFFDGKDQDETELFSDDSTATHESFPTEEQRPKTFVYVTYDMVMNPENSHAISFNAAGTAIEVRDTALLAEHVLPKYFRHKNVTSFYRQLNSYGFRTIRSPAEIAHTFSHETFKRNHPELLCMITRKKCKENKFGKAAITIPKPPVTVAYYVPKPVAAPVEKKVANASSDLSKMIQELRDVSSVQQERAVILENKNKKLAEENQAILKEGEEVYRAMKYLLEKQADTLGKLFGTQASQAFCEQAQSQIFFPENLSSTFQLSNDKLSMKEEAEIAFNESTLTDAQLVLPDQDLLDLETLLSFEDYELL